MVELNLLNMLQSGELKLAVFIIYYVCFHIYRAKLFNFAGEKGIYTLIPFYGTMQQYKIAGMSRIWFIAPYVSTIFLFKKYFNFWLFFAVLMFSVLMQIIREVKTAEIVFEKKKPFGLLLFAFPVLSWIYLFRDKKKMSKRVIAKVLIAAILSTSIISSVKVDTVYAMENTVDKDVNVDNFNYKDKKQRKIMNQRAAERIKLAGDLLGQDDSDVRALKWNIQRVVYGLEISQDAEYAEFPYLLVYGNVEYSNNTCKKFDIIMPNLGDPNQENDFPEDLLTVKQDLDLSELKDIVGTKICELDVGYNIKEIKPKATEKPKKNLFEESEYQKYIDELSEIRKQFEDSKNNFHLEKIASKVNKENYVKMQNEIDLQNCLLTEVVSLNEKYSTFTNETEENIKTFSSKCETLEKEITEWIDKINKKATSKEFKKYSKTDYYMEAVDWLDKNIINPDTLGKTVVVELAKAAAITAATIALPGVGVGVLANEAMDLVEGIMVGVIYASKEIDSGVAIDTAVLDGMQNGLTRYFIDKGVEIASTAVISGVSKGISKIFKDTKLGKICNDISENIDNALNPKKKVKMDEFVDDGIKINGKIELKQLRQMGVDEFFDIDDVADDAFVQGTKKLKANTMYKAGEHDYRYITDGKGRITGVRVNGLKDMLRDERLSLPSNKTPGKIKSDHAFHLIADRFGGSNKMDNLISVNGSFNQGEYKQLENLWGKAVEKNQKVKIKIDINYQGSATRPAYLEIKYWIDDGAAKVMKFYQ